MNIKESISFEVCEANELLAAAGIIHGRISSRTSGVSVVIAFPNAFYQNNPRMAALCMSQFIIHLEMAHVILEYGTYRADQKSRLMCEMEAAGVLSSEEALFEKLGSARSGRTTDLVCSDGHIYLGKRLMGEWNAQTQMGAFIRLSELVRGEGGKCPVPPDKALELFARLYEVLPP